MTSTTSIPILPIGNILCGCSLDNYPLGTIQPTIAVTFPSLYSTQTTVINSCTPSAEEYDLRDAIASAIIYQNILDPTAHGINFNCTFEVLKSNALEKLRAVKLANGWGLPAHLENLTKLHTDTNRIGCHVGDSDMVSIILQSLPPVMTFVSDVTSNLLTYWGIVYKKEVEADIKNSAVMNALTVSILSRVTCNNCGIKGHTDLACWVIHGGKEGQAPKWWRAPKGKEPHQSFIDAARVARAAKVAKFTAATTTSTQHPAPALLAANPTAAFTSPMPVYTLSNFISSDNADEADVGDPPSIYATDVNPEQAHVMTFLDSGASENCVVNCAWFTTYKKLFLEGSTAVKSRGKFAVKGKGIAEFDVWLANGSVRRILVKALHTPGFAMNLISIPTLDTRGFQGTWGGSRLSVVSWDGTEIVDGLLMKEIGWRRLYQVDVVDKKDGGRGVVAAVAGCDRNQPTDLETWHQWMGHTDVCIIKRMADKGLVDSLTLVNRRLRGMCKDCILGKHDKMPFNDEVVHETKPLERVHLDLWGKARTPSWSGAVYMMLVSDGGTSMKFPLFLNNKTAAKTLAVFETWVTEAELQTGEWVLCVRFDLGKEFNNELFLGYCTRWGIRVEKIPKDSSSANGHIERGNCTMIKGTRTQLIDSGLDHRFWAESAMEHCSVRGFIPSTRHPNTIPWVAWFQKKNMKGDPIKLNVSHLEAGEAELEGEDGGLYGPSGLPHL
ncbi:Retrotransposon Ty1-copia subclass [Mycena venus]|uniref:Retrotransposon Ty1-copia subclass n=1 Tax=Mycena venus TaxID=2733690 RepID=A0A8H7DFE8_9AGAR|nr:Retrotransposon Ty1-copia subclass [Mycena venus]